MKHADKKSKQMHTFNGFAEEKKKKPDNYCDKRI